MAGPRLSAEEQALWKRVAETVRPLGKRLVEPTPLVAAPPARVTPKPAAALPKPQPPQPARIAPGETLDGGWERRLKRGMVLPERTIDLHGHTLSSAHAALDRGLDLAIADDVRTLLLITGRPPREGTVPPRRGAIRAEIGDWLAGSRHAPRIAAIRNAHPRHGGAGALYLILRRRRAPIG